MKIFITLALILPLLTGCASFSLFGNRVKPVEIQTRAVERTRLNIPHPAPLKVAPIEWVVITPENAEEVFAKLQERNVDLVLFGLTDNGYESLAVTMAELRNYIATQRQVIIKYQQYYEPAKPEEAK